MEALGILPGEKKTDSGYEFGHKMRAFFARTPAVRIVILGAGQVGSSVRRKPGVPKPTTSRSWTSTRHQGCATSATAWICRTVVGSRSRTPPSLLAGGIEDVRQR